MLLCCICYASFHSFTIMISLPLFFYSLPSSSSATSSSSSLSPSTPPISSQSSSSLSLSSSAPPSLQHVHLSEEMTMTTTTVKRDTSSRTTVVSPLTTEEGEGDKDKQLQQLTGVVDKVSEPYCDDYSSPPSSLSANNASLPSSESVSSLTLQSPSSSSLSSNPVEKDVYPVTTARVFGGRFSKSPEERIKILSQRRDELLRTAREAYLLKQRQKLTTSSNPSTSTMTPVPPSSSMQQSDRHSQM